VAVSNQTQNKAYASMMIVIAASVHVAIGLYFLFIQIPLMVWISVFDLAVYAVTFLINRAGNTRLSSFILVIKVTSFAVLSTFLFGTNVNAQWVVIGAALPAALYLDFTKIQRIWILAFMAVAVNVQLAFPFMFVPPLYMPDDAILPFFFGNIAFFAFIVSVATNAIITHRLTAAQAKEVEGFKQASVTDPLTQISNRRYAEIFFNNLTAQHKAAPFVFAMMDIDDFKQVNDTYGHDVGDAVLAAVADILRQNTRQEDLLCRWGGEEFLIGLPGCNQEVAKRVLEKIRKNVEEIRIDTESGIIGVTVTIGASLLVGNDIKATLQVCDKNLYAGKWDGKNQTVF